MVMHAQYLASTAEGRTLEALNAVIDYLLNQQYGDRSVFFDFGVSTESDGRYLNLGLVSNKESYGARGIVYDTYRLDALGRE